MMHASGEEDAEAAQWTQHLPLVASLFEYPYAQQFTQPEDLASMDRPSSASEDMQHNVMFHAHVRLAHPQVTKPCMSTRKQHVRFCQVQSCMVELMALSKCYDHNWAADLIDMQK